MDDLFDINPTKWYKLSNEEILSEDGTVPLVTNSSTDNGIMGFSKLTANNQGNSISCSDTTLGADTMYYQKDDFIGYQHIQHLVPKFQPFNRYIASVIISATRVATQNAGYDYAHKFNREAMRKTSIFLPEKSKGVIDFEFIDNFVRELERARLRELEAYLAATGLNNYELTATDKAALNNFQYLNWQEFNVKKLFGDSTRGKRLKSEDRIPGTLPFVTAGEAETGVSAFIGNNVTIFSKNTTTIDMFGSAKYRNYEYGADDHVAVVHTENLEQHAAIFVTSACHKAAHTGKFDYGHNFYAKDADELNIMLPVCADGKTPDLATMEQIVAAVQKIVIADVAKYTARNLEATQQVIEAQEEPEVEQTITPLIHSEYKPGYIPLYTLRAACGYFGEGRLPEEEGWIDASGLGFTSDPKRHFAVHAKGDSMLPKIKDGDICIFEWYNAGSRNGEIVLSQISEYDDAYDGRYTIKRYYSEKTVTDEGWQHSKVELQPLNPDFEPIELSEDDDVRTIGIFKCVL